jgi:hypothetical protein
VTVAFFFVNVVIGDLPLLADESGNSRRRQTENRRLYGAGVNLPETNKQMRYKSLHVSSHMQTRQPRQPLSIP